MSGLLIPGNDTPWSGGRASERALCVLAPNPSPMTLDGTNTWILVEPGSSRCVVIDPGPLDHAHLNRVIESIDELGCSVAFTLLTHGHPDHSEGAREFASLTHSSVRALDPIHRLGDEGLVGGDVIEISGLEIHVVDTPGHSSDSVSFVLPAEGSMLTGDTVLGRGTSMIAWPDGRLGDYLVSLARLRDLADRTAAERVLPGHGPVLDEPRDVLDAYLSHRGERLEHVRAAIVQGLRSPAAIVDALYEIPEAVKPAAELSVRAQLEYLAELGEFDPTT